MIKDRNNGELMGKKRIITIEIDIVDKDKAAWIWENHSGEDTNNGVYVRKIMEGQIPECDCEENE